MKRGRSVSLIVLIIIVGFAGSQSIQAQFTGEERVRLLNKPKDIVYDSVRKCCYISSYQGDAIVRQDSLGNQDYLLEGINSPMGLHLLGDTLVIASNNPSKVTLFNVGSAGTILEIPAPGAQYLSMMDLDPRTGLIYIVEQRGSIYKLNILQASCSLFVPVNAGVAYGSQTLEVDTSNNRLLVFKWDPGFIVGVGLSDSTDIVNVSNQYISKIQSSQKGPNGDIYVSSYNNNSIYIYENALSNPPTVIVSGLMQPSGLAYNPDHHSLMVCNYGGNFISEISLIPTSMEGKRCKCDALCLYPSPADQTCNVRFTGSNPAMVRLYLFDMKGKLIWSFCQEFTAETCHLIEIPTKDLAMGNYVINCILDDIPHPAISLSVIH